VSDFLFEVEEVVGVTESFEASSPLVHAESYFDTAPIAANLSLCHPVLLRPWTSRLSMPQRSLGPMEHLAVIVACFRFHLA
jgi:hypothetical protein